MQSDSLLLYNIYKCIYCIIGNNYFYIYQGGISIDDAKKKLLKVCATRLTSRCLDYLHMHSQQLPNVPKKLEKFNNYIGNSFKIKDDSVS